MLRKPAIVPLLLCFAFLSCPRPKPELVGTLQLQLPQPGTSTKPGDTLHIRIEGQSTFTLGDYRIELRRRSDKALLHEKHGRQNSKSPLYTTTWFNDLTAKDSISIYCRVKSTEAAGMLELFSIFPSL